MKINYNLIAIFNQAFDHVLMCKRSKDPYGGLYNLVGGKIDEHEDSLLAAYRELFEETNITKEQVTLTHFNDFLYYVPSIKIEVYVGWLHQEASIYGEENELEWISIEEDFFNSHKFAGDGNIGHIIKQVHLFKDMI